MMAICRKNAFANNSVDTCVCALGQEQLTCFLFYVLYFKIAFKEFKGYEVVGFFFLSFFPWIYFTTLNMFSYVMCIWGSGYIYVAGKPHYSILNLIS